MTPLEFQTEANHLIRTRQVYTGTNYIIDQQTEDVFDYLVWTNHPSIATSEVIRKGDKRWPEIHRQAAIRPTTVWVNTAPRTAG